MSPFLVPPVDRPSVLFVDDEQRVLDGLRRSLFTVRDRWDVRAACGGAIALEMLAQQPACVVISDLRMPGMDGLTFLQEVSARWPEAVRIILSGQEDPDSAPRAWQIAHQYLSKPCEGRAVISALDKAYSTHRLLRSPELRALAGRLNTLPTTPGTLVQIEQLSTKDGLPMRDVVSIVERDVALTSKVLQVVNSAYFGVARSIGSVECAIQVMGFDLLRALIYAHEVGHAFPCLLASWSPEEEQRHTLRVAAVAKALGDSRDESADLFTAGILHDVGKLVLASRAPELLERSIALSLERGVPLYVAEREVYGVSHAELGAYLMGLWGLPWPLVEAVALHHSPGRWSAATSTLAPKVALAEMVLGSCEGDCSRFTNMTAGTMEFAALSFDVLGDAAAVAELTARASAAIPADER
jgi:HD-like signal output (HDOD) protein/ActR/RegA family two-component response regulator